jgi:hypothetical protein
MKTASRIALQIACAACVLVVIVLLGLRAYSESGSVVALLPLGSERGVLFRSNRSGYCELAWVEGWPGARFGVWAGEGWENVGPFMIWWKWRGPPRFAKLEYRSGTVMTPRVSADGAVAYDHSYARAQQLGMPGWLKGPPESAVIRARQIQFPHGVAIVLAGLLPVGLLVLRLKGARSALRAWRRYAAGHCAGCGYDLRGSEGVCPECGRGVEPVAGYRWPRWVFRIERFSLVLFIAVTLLWVGSQAFPCAFHHNFHQLIGNTFVSRGGDLGVQDGQVWFRKFDYADPIPQSLPATKLVALERMRGLGGQTDTYWKHAPGRTAWSMGIFGVLRNYSRSATGWEIVLGVRLVTLALLLGILPTIRLWVGAWPVRKRGGDSTKVSAMETGRARTTRDCG